VLAPVELNIPVDKSNPFKFNVPVVSVVVEDAAIVRADPNVVVMPLALMVKEPNVVLPLLIIVPLKYGFNVNEPKLPLVDNVALVTFIIVDGIVNAVVPKLIVLK
jgi:hypothetical protein